MKNTFGNSVTVTLFGESHGSHIGIVIDGMESGIRVDEEFIRYRLSLRSSANELSTKRKEPDECRIVSGVFNGYTTGTPICMIIENTNTVSKDYDSLKILPRPGHADYTALIRYKGFQDHRGGGHFSGRLTAPLTAAGALMMSAMEDRGIKIGTHISSLHGIKDRDFSSSSLEKDIDTLNDSMFAVLDDDKGELMKEAIRSAKREGDSVGGILETAVIGVPAGIGEPWFDSVESRLSHILFSVPAVKGLEFGAGFGFADMLGSEANDAFYTDGKSILTKTNNNGGINGGITNGMPIVFRCVIKPTPSIYKEQDTVDLSKNENAKLAIHGRHDPAIIHRARAVIDSVTAIALYDMLSESRL